MQIKWPNDSRDLVFLSTKNGERCRFTGNFEKDIVATAEVEGCFGSIETKVTISDAPYELTGTIVLKNGVTTTLKSKFHLKIHTGKFSTRTLCIYLGFLEP